MAEAIAPATTFHDAVREWHHSYESEWSPSHKMQAIAILERDVVPFLGRKPVKDISPAEVLEVLLQIANSRTVGVAHRARLACNQVFRLAVLTGRAERNPVAELHRMLPPVDRAEKPAIELKDFFLLLRAIDVYDGSTIVKTSMQLAPLLLARSGELRNAEWSEINWETAEWIIPAQKRKNNRSHTVPLSTQAMVILRDVHALTGHSRFVFPSQRSPFNCINENAVTAAFRRLGYKGAAPSFVFRKRAAMILLEELGYPSDLVACQLGHTIDDLHSRKFYARESTRLVQRREMMQRLADYLKSAKSGQRLPNKGGDV
ncbi:site-specific integrase [Geomonas sp. RF6]|uniref:tyrosine-type recombinase/integrase n=1 Tax=Geomonas sp. RF6 TaxID=2897342 RepID=UPI001E3777EA|nr:site-specific integrase [Geomonas sp. RF6]UFS72641.1 site-specific integrase [Geomonas sp. RF6]